MVYLFSLHFRCNQKWRRRQERFCFHKGQLRPHFLQAVDKHVSFCSVWSGEQLIATATNQSKINHFSKSVNKYVYNNKKSISTAQHLFHRNYSKHIHAPAHTSINTYNLHSLIYAPKYNLQPQRKIAAHGEKHGRSIVNKEMPWPSI